MRVCKVEMVVAGVTRLSKQWCILVACVAVPAVQLNAQFVTRTVTEVNGDFNNFQPQLGFEVGEGTSQIEWGDPQEGSFSSFLQFDGYDALPGFEQVWSFGGQAVMPGQSFRVGNITFRNGFHNLGSSLENHSVDLNLSVFGSEFLIDNHPFLVNDTLEIRIRQTVTALPPEVSEEEAADYIYFPEFPELGSFRVFENKSTSVPLFVEFGSLLPTAFGPVADPGAGAVVPSIVDDPNAPPTSNAVWNEQPDAGGLPSVAQVVSGNGPIGSIAGSLETDADKDMFLIQITHPEYFSTEAFSPLFFPLQVFLFDLSGRGLWHDENGVISPGSVSLAPGLYYLAVSDIDNDPVSSGGEIFSDTGGGPSGPGGSGAITGWNDDLFFPGSALGFYTIDLTGAAFVVPEPSSLFLTAIGLCGARVALRRRRR